MYGGSLLVSSHLNKKGMQLATIISIILLVVATGAILGVYNKAFTDADDKTIENVCRGTNALRYGTETDVGVGQINVIPRGCKTIDKKEDIPSSQYQGKYSSNTEAAKAELREMTARCWWMWLEGIDKNMFNQQLWEGRKCFICYTFSVEEGAGFSYSDFISSMAASPYTARDDSDECAGGGGGECRNSCGADFPRETPSAKCREGEKCCVAQNLQDECINKGGRCASSNPSGHQLYTKWSCAGRNERCYVQDQNFASYFDYITGIAGLEGGKGLILLDDSAGFFSSGKKYAISFMSPDEHATWKTWVGFTAAGAGAVAVGVLTGGLTVPAIIALGGSSLTALLTAEADEHNFVYLSEFDNVAQACVIEGDD